MEKITRIFESKNVEDIVALHEKTGATIYWIHENKDPETLETIYVYEWMDGKSLEDLEAEEQQKEEEEPNESN